MGGAFFLLVQGLRMGGGSTQLLVAPCPYVPGKAVDTVLSVSARAVTSADAFGKRAVDGVTYIGAKPSSSADSVPRKPADTSADYIPGKRSECT